MLSSQLAAGGVDVAAQASADGGRHAQALQLLLEGRDAAAGLVGALHHVVQGDHIDVAGHTPELFGDQLRLPVVVVDAVDHGVLEADAAACLFEVAVAGIEQLLHIIRAVHRHDTAAAGTEIRSRHRSGSLICQYENRRNGTVAFRDVFGRTQVSDTGSPDSISAVLVKGISIEHRKK